MGQCKVSSSLCSVHQVWWRLHWVLQLAWASGLGGDIFADCWHFPDVEALLGNHSAQSLASLRVTSSEHTMGQCKVKCSLCSVKQVRWSLHWVLRPGWAGGLWGV